jgi:hypothetical protein
MIKQNNTQLQLTSIYKIKQVLKKKLVIFKPFNRGRSPLLSTLDIATITYLQGLYQIKTLKSLHLFVLDNYKNYFKIPCYSSFVRTVNLNTKYLLPFIKTNSNNSTMKIIDSTPLEVCKIQREKRHKTCKVISSKSYNGMYWYYGLKLHILIEPSGSIIDARITTARIHDSKLHSIFIPKYPNSIYIADKGYLSKDNRVLAALYNSSIFTPIRKNMKSSELAKKDINSYPRIRKRVETVFSILKGKYNLISTLPRSVNGYLAHYIRCLFQYSMFYKI